jgi:hypothetical protein
MTLTKLLLITLLTLSLLTGSFKSFAQSNLDTDKDGITDILEDKNNNKIVDTNETNPQDPDTDSDGYSDGTEVAANKDPLDPNSYPNTTSTPLFTDAQLQTNFGITGINPINIDKIGTCNKTEAIIFIDNLTCKWPLKGAINNYYSVSNKEFKAKISIGKDEGRCYIEGNKTIKPLLTCSNIPTKDAQVGPNTVELISKNPLQSDLGTSSVNFKIDTLAGSIYELSASEDREISRSCTPADNDQLTNCTFVLPLNRYLPPIYLMGYEDKFTGSCIQSENRIVKCTNISVPSIFNPSRLATSLNQEVKAKVILAPELEHIVQDDITLYKIYIKKGDKFPTITGIAKYYSGPAQISLESNGKVILIEGLLNELGEFTPNLDYIIDLPEGDYSTRIIPSGANSIGMYTTFSLRVTVSNLDTKILTPTKLTRTGANSEIGNITLPILGLLISVFIGLRNKKKYIALICIIGVMSSSTSFAQFNVQTPNPDAYNPNKITKNNPAIEKSSCNFYSVQIDTLITCQVTFKNPNPVSANKTLVSFYETPVKYIDYNKARAKYANDPYVLGKYTKEQIDGSLYNIDPIMVARYEKDPDVYLSKVRTNKGCYNPSKDFKTYICPDLNIGYASTGEFGVPIQISFGSFESIMPNYELNQEFDMVKYDSNIMILSSERDYEKNLSIKYPGLAYSMGEVAGTNLIFEYSTRYPSYSTKEFVKFVVFNRLTSEKVAVLNSSFKDGINQATYNTPKDGEFTVSICIGDGVPKPDTTSDCNYNLTSKEFTVYPTIGFASLEGTNDPKRDTFNLIFNCSDSLISTDDCKKIVRDVTAYDSKIGFFDTKTLESLTVPNTQSLVKIGLFAGEPIKSNKNKFQLYVIDKRMSSISSTYTFAQAKKLGIDTNQATVININTVNGVGSTNASRFKDIINPTKSQFSDARGIADSAGVINLFYGNSMQSNKSSTLNTLNHEIGHAMFGLTDEYIVNSDRADTKFGYPNCATPENRDKWWPELVGKNYIGLKDPFYDEVANYYKTIPSPITGYNNYLEYINSKKMFLPEYYAMRDNIKGGCFGPDTGAGVKEVFRPTMASTMNTNAGIWGPVNRKRVEQILNLVSGKAPDTCANKATNMPVCDDFLGSKIGFCPTGATFDVTLGYCTEGEQVYGPFPKAMIDTCTKMYASKSCITPTEYIVEGNKVNLLRYSKLVVAAIKGKALCPIGTSQKAAGTGIYCLELAKDSANKEDRIYGRPVPKSVVNGCIKAGFGSGCYLQSVSKATFDKFYK